MRATLNKTFLAAVVLLPPAAAWANPFGFGGEPKSDLYVDPQPVVIEGYDGVAMEPFISPDGRFLFFNNSNDRRVRTTIRFARRTGLLTFRYLGELPGVNAEGLSAVPSLDLQGRFYFTTLREYPRTLKSVYVGAFDGERVIGAGPVEGEIWPRHLGAVDLDVGISLDGDSMYISRARFIPFVPLPAPIASRLMVARRRQGRFELDARSDELLGKVNRGGLVYAPAVSPDGRELYFTRASFPAGMRVLVATRAAEGEPFGEPRVLSALSGKVEAPSVSSDLQELFFHKDVGGRWKIFRARRNEAARRADR